jgi:hypothetical protein
MKRRFLTVVALVALCLITLTLTISSGVAQLQDVSGFETPGRPASEPEIKSPPSAPGFSTQCALQPEKKGKPSPFRSTVQALGVAPGSITLSRFRQDSSKTGSADKTPIASLFNQRLTAFTPKEEIVLIDPTNYGDRYFKDIYGNPALLDPIVVLHETVGSAYSTLNFFRTPHPRDEDQASYHTLIKLDGTVVYMVPPDKRAYGAGNSSFKGQSVKTSADLPGSVNNFAYHISLETPYDGNDNGYSHSGYTQAQYQSLAWLVAKTGVPDDRITTHRDVDRSRSRIDPRSFQFSRFMALLKTYPRTSEIAIGCTGPTETPQS